ncbi:GNAT family N-acetyltransferase [Desulfobacter postgatei]|uniref:Protein involved in cellulose biosynthesis (CelD) n=1 Tax=Desulfobacter postgatei 2ac9 TaxID=879212 RepID=I5B266_9BACT|nr:GNAT family N-acetyltransferase [Desulfobacter postgatei]EIM63579.1 protein involved in cellulose biosynthesis (CelD) [Desulfobacter postgatei 2ac9]
MKDTSKHKIDSKNYCFPFSALPENLKKNWIELIENKRLNPTLHPGWVKISLSSGKTEIDHTRVFVHFDADKPAGFLPYRVEKRFKLGMPFSIVFLYDFVTYHLECVCLSSIRALLEAFFSDTPKWHILMISNIIDDGPTAESLRQLCHEKDLGFQEFPVDVSPYLTLKGTFDDLLASKNRKFRYKYRKRNEMLASTEEMEMAWYPAASQASEFLEAFVAVEANSWKAESGVAVSFSNREGRYYAQLLPFLAEKNALMANVLWNKNKPIAYSLCCHWGDWIGQLKTGFDSRFKDLSPGALVIDGCLEKAFASGAKEFDFLGTPGQMEPDPHKLHWTRQTRRHVRFEIYSSQVRSKIFGTLKKMRTAP